MARKKSPATEMNVAEKQELPLAQRLNGLITDVNKLKEALGVSAQAINQYKMGTSRPSLENLCKIADFYGVTTDYLLGRTGTKSINPTVQAAAQYTGLSEATINSLRDAHNLVSQMGKNIWTGYRSYHIEGNLVDLFFGSPNFREVVVAFYGYVEGVLSYEDAQSGIIEDLRNRGVLPDGQEMITADEIFNVANAVGGGDARQRLFSEALFLMSCEENVRFKKFQLIEKLGKIADSYKAEIDIAEAE